MLRLPDKPPNCLGIPSVLSSAEGSRCIGCGFRSTCQSIGQRVIDQLGSVEKSRYSAALAGFKVPAGLVMLDGKCYTVDSKTDTKSLSDEQIKALKSVPRNAQTVFRNLLNTKSHLRARESVVNCLNPFLENTEFLKVAGDVFVGEDSFTKKDIHKLLTDSKLYPKSRIGALSTRFCTLCLILGLVTKDRKQFRIVK